MHDNSLVIVKEYDHTSMCDVFRFRFKMVGAKPGEDYLVINYRLDDTLYYKLSEDQLINEMVVKVGSELAAKFPLPDIALNSMVVAMREKIAELQTEKAKPSHSHFTWESGQKTLYDKYMDEYGNYFHNDQIAKAFDTLEEYSKINNQNGFLQQIDSLPGVKAQISKLLVPCENAASISPKKKPCDYLLKQDKFEEKIEVMDAVMHLNDLHKISREKIADWLQSLHDKGIVDLAFKVDLDEGEDNG